jgi:8-oxo-dGTP diphosphatase
MEEEILRAFGNRLRVRVCGICVVDNKILLIKHKNIGKAGYLWSPPGGGLQFGESVKDCLEREFQEETNLSIHIERFLFVHEFLDHPLHAIELFFEVSITDGFLRLGKDPEMQENDQILEDIAFLDYQTLSKEPKDCLHKVLQNIQSIEELWKLEGFNQQK